MRTAVMSTYARYVESFPVCALTSYCISSTQTTPENTQPVPTKNTRSRVLDIGGQVLWTVLVFALFGSLLTGMLKASTKQATKQAPAQIALARAAYQH
ncbi:hypothetical protein EON83_23245 [bacterium]|nr:MAG: hypothetical protein EON83_23245 [bacterium]